MKSTLAPIVELATFAMVVVVLLARRWRLPGQPRLALIWGHARKPFSPGVELAIELVLIAVGCVALSLGTVLLIFALFSLHGSA